MFGHGWLIEPCGGACVFGVVLVPDEDVEGVVGALLVDWVVLVVVLGAAAAPAMPATAPPVASAPTTNPTRIMLVRFIGETSDGGSGYAHHPGT
jgi:hypothetical protein